jgi:translation initiation factor 3 subunit M
MNVPVFIDITLEEQAEELRVYFKNLGAEISSERSDKGIEDDLHKIIGVCDAALKQPTADKKQPEQLEEVLNGIVSMLALVTGEKSENLILAFCEKLSKAPSDQIGLICLKVLWSLYQSLEESSPMRFHVYLYLVQLAGKTDQIGLVFKSVEAFKLQFTSAPPSNEQYQKLLRLLHEVLLNGKKSEQASEVMVMLLGTYTTENASQAREEAQRCIVASLADPQTFLLDHLLQLKPVKFLEGELIHDLLKIFVSEKLESYQKFYESHREFVTGLGLKHEDNLTKMKLLTFMQLAETRSTITFGEIQQHLQVQEADVEDFLIDLLKTKLVRAKIDQATQVVTVSSTMHRTFTKEHWHNLHGLLTDWKSNIHNIRDQIAHLATAQIDMKRQAQAAL